MSSDKLPGPFLVRIEPSGWSFSAPVDASILAAARAAKIDMPASCRNGTCRTCLCKLVDGRIGYSIAWPGVSPEEKRDGYILPCVAVAESDLVLHVPHARRLPG